MTFDKNNVSLLRKYITEFAIIALAGAVITLYFKVDALNVFIRENLLQQNANYQKSIQENTNALNNFFFNNQKQFPK